MIKFYSKGQLLGKENKESLDILFFKFKYSKLIIFWEACAKPTKVLQYMECLESKFLKIEMFEFRCVSTKS